MNATELHPETLLESAVRGELGAEDREVLAAHVEVCPACSLYLGARTWFEPELVAREEDAAQNLEAISQAMARVRASGNPVLSRHVRMRWPVRFLMAALVLGGIAAGAYYGRLRQPSAIAPAASGEASAPIGPRVEYPRGGSARPTATVEDLDRTTATGPSSPSSQPRGRTQPVASKPPSPGELFARANQLRREGRDPEAMALYRDLQRAFPESREAKLSQATLARLLLEHGQASEALSGFDSYLKSGDTGPMTEDALVGRAMALMKLKRRDEERTTWQELLARYPNSIHASRARARLGELD